MSFAKKFHYDYVSNLKRDKIVCDLDEKNNDTIQFLF